MASTSLPLSRFTVLDLTAWRAGPTAVRQLADWGANVIKVEPPQAEGAMDGIVSRHGSDFQNMHRNKRSLSLNLKDQRGRDLFYQMVATADVVVENYRSDVKFRLRVDYETLRAINPRIVYGSISGFGQSGPYATRPGVDQIAQGMGGLMSITGEPGQGPMRVGIAIDDLCAGHFLAQGILLALLEREASGEGQWVHTSLLEAQIAMLDFQATRWLMDGHVPGQAGNSHPTIIPMGLFPSADGQILIAPQPHMFKRLCELMGADDLAADPRFKTRELRLQHKDEVIERISGYTKTRTGAEWSEILGAAGIPCGPINRIDQTFADPQVKHLGIARATEHRKLGSISLVGQPITMVRTPQPSTLPRAAPDCGEHTDEILQAIGVNAEAITALRAEGVV